MEVRQLNTLIRAAQFQSFSKAAESLGYSQSAVTVQIKALEEELGVRLFDRMGKRVILTAQGQCFLEYANSILDTIHNARRALSEDAELEGCLHILQRLDTDLKSSKLDADLLMQKALCELALAGRA